MNPNFIKWWRRHFLQPSELDLHRMDYRACRREGWESPGELLAAHKRACDLLKQLVDGIDVWNESAQEIIGRQPNYQWPALEEARAFVRHKNLRNLK